jgi:dihydropteroate synthase
MGIINVTPDSFSDGGRYLDVDAAVAHGLALIDAGADVLDVGGESTRPGAEPVPADEELARVLPVVRRLSADTDVPISIDTSKPEVAAAALAAGACIVNDVSSGRRDPAIFQVVADAGAGYVVMHMQGEPRTMQQDPHYDDVMVEVGDFLLERATCAVDAGIERDALCVDPGIGFGKRPEHNVELLARLPELVARVELPVLVGTSRKAFLGKILGAGHGDSPIPEPAARDDATLATVVWAVDRGARVVRVHDVAGSAQAVRLLEAMADIDAKAVA